MLPGSLLGLTLGTVVEGDQALSPRARKEALQNMHPKLLPAWKPVFAFYDNEDEPSEEGQLCELHEQQKVVGREGAIGGSPIGGRCTLASVATSAFTPVRGSSSVIGSVSRGQTKEETIRAESVCAPSNLTPTTTTVHAGRGGQDRGGAEAADGGKLTTMVPVVVAVEARASIRLHLDYSLAKEEGFDGAFEADMAVFLFGNGGDGSDNTAAQGGRRVKVESLASGSIVASFVVYAEPVVEPAVSPLSGKDVREEQTSVEAVQAKLQSGEMPSFSQLSQTLGQAVTCDPPLMLLNPEVPPIPSPQDSVTLPTATLVKTDDATATGGATGGAAAGGSGCSSMEATHDVCANTEVREEPPLFSAEERERREVEQEVSQMLNRTRRTSAARSILGDTYDDCLDDVSIMDMNRRQPDAEEPGGGAQEEDDTGEEDGEDGGEGGAEGAEKLARNNFFKAPKLLQMSDSDHTDENTDGTDGASVMSEGVYESDGTSSCVSSGQDDERGGVTEATSPRKAARIQKREEQRHALGKAVAVLHINEYKRMLRWMESVRPVDELMIADWWTYRVTHNISDTLHAACLYELGLEADLCDEWLMSNMGGGGGGEDTGQRIQVFDAGEWSDEPTTGTETDEGGFMGDEGKLRRSVCANEDEGAAREKVRGETDKEEEGEEGEATGRKEDVKTSRRAEHRRSTTLPFTPRSVSGSSSKASTPRGAGGDGEGEFSDAAEFYRNDLLSQMQGLEREALVVGGNEAVGAGSQAYTPDLLRNRSHRRRNGEQFFVVRHDTLATHNEVVDIFKKGDVVGMVDDVLPLLHRYVTHLETAGAEAVDARGGETGEGKVGGSGGSDTGAAAAEHSERHLRVEELLRVLVIFHNLELMRLTRGGVGLILAAIDWALAIPGITAKQTSAATSAREVLAAAAEVLVTADTVARQLHVR
jgi:hypothetical protein